MARKRAMGRLIAIYPEMWEAVFAEEMAKLGQPPVKTRLDAKRRLHGIEPQT